MRKLGDRRIKKGAAARAGELLLARACKLYRRVSLYMYICTLSNILFIHGTIQPPKHIECCSRFEKPKVHDFNLSAPKTLHTVVLDSYMDALVSWPHRPEDRRAHGYRMTEPTIRDVSLRAPGIIILLAVVGAPLQAGVSHQIRAITY